MHTERQQHTIFKLQKHVHSQSYGIIGRHRLVVRVLTLHCGQNSKEADR